VKRVTPPAGAREGAPPPLTASKGTAMPAIRSPGVVLKLWTRAKESYEGKKPDLIGNGVKEKTGIKTQLNALRDRARKGLTTESDRTDFLKKRDAAARALTKYCRFLKTSKAEDRAKLAKFLRTVKQLTVIVKGFTVDAIDLAEDDLSLDAIAAVDTTALDQELERPEQPEAEEAPAPAPPPPAPPPVPPKPQESPLSLEPLKKRLNALMPDVARTKSHPVAGAKIEALAREIVQLLQERKANDAYQKLNALALLVKKALANPAPQAPAAPPTGDSRKWAATHPACVKMVTLLNQEAERLGKGVRDLQKKLAAYAAEVGADVIQGLGRVTDDLPAVAPAMDDLARALKQQDGGRVSESLQGVRDAVRRCTAYLRTDQLVQLVGGNPFQPLDLARFGSVLDAAVKVSASVN
jgi:hypothetical protein